MSLLLKLERPYVDCYDNKDPLRSTLTYFFRERHVGEGVAQIQVEITLKTEGQDVNIESLSCSHYTQHMQWIDLFGPITPGSTDKFGEWDNADDLANSVAITAFAFMRN